MSTQATTMQETNHASLKKGYSSALDQNFNTLNRPDKGFQILLSQAKLLLQKKGKMKKMKV